MTLTSNKKNSIGTLQIRFNLMTDDGGQREFCHFYCFLFNKNVCDNVFH